MALLIGRKRPSRISTSSPLPKDFVITWPNCNSAGGPIHQFAQHIFRVQPEDDDNELANPLEKLMSLSIFPKKFTKAHLNASF
jgi:hypothetical protein